MAKQSKKIVYVLLLCVYIRQFTHVRFAVTTMEVSNIGLHSRRLISKTDCSQLDQQGLQICTVALLA